MAFLLVNSHSNVKFHFYRKEFVTSFLEGRTSYDELALIFEVPTSYIGREVSSSSVITKGYFLVIS